MPLDTRHLAGAQFILHHVSESRLPQIGPALAHATLQVREMIPETAWICCKGPVCLLLKDTPLQLVSNGPSCMDSLGGLPYVTVLEHARPVCIWLMSTLSRCCIG